VKDSEKKITNSVRPCEVERASLSSVIIYTLDADPGSAAMSIMHQSIPIEWYLGADEQSKRGTKGRGC
jgi:hypothetical protein